MGAQTPDDLELIWSSDDTSVATVSSTGTVTGVNAGTTTIRVRDADNSITEGMTYTQITDIMGLPQAQVTFGLLVVRYDLENSNQKLLMEYIQQGGQLVARSCAFDGGTNNE